MAKQFALKYKLAYKRLTFKDLYQCHYKFWEQNHDYLSKKSICKYNSVNEAERYETFFLSINKKIHSL